MCRARVKNAVPNVCGRDTPSLWRCHRNTLRGANLALRYQALKFCRWKPLYASLLSSTKSIRHIRCDLLTDARTDCAEDAACNLHQTNMATVHPSIADIYVTSAGEQVEVDMLKQLAQGLSEHYELFYSVDWTCAEPQRDSHGELDIVVVNSAGDIAVPEVKAGEIEVTREGLFKHYGAERKNVGQQAGWQFRSILKRLKAESMEVRLQHCLVLPHFRIGDEGTVDYPRDRIADAQDCLDLAGFIQRRLGAGRPDAKAIRRRSIFDSGHGLSRWRATLISGICPQPCAGRSSQPINLPGADSN